MLQQPDKAEFVIATEKEVNSMFQHKIWKTVLKSEMTLHYAKEHASDKEIKRQQISMIWSFKRKRNPDGSLCKHKARLCCHGGQQQRGINFWDIYAPVVSWSSIRSIITLSKLHKLHTKSVDFIQAYSQALTRCNQIHPHTIGSRTPNIKRKECAEARSKLI